MALQMAGMSSRSLKWGDSAPSPEKNLQSWHERGHLSQGAWEALGLAEGHSLAHAHRQKVYAATEKMSGPAPYTLSPPALRGSCTHRGRDRRSRGAGRGMGGGGGRGLFLAGRPPPGVDPRTPRTPPALPPFLSGPSEILDLPPQAPPKSWPPPSPLSVTDWLHCATLHYVGRHLGTRRGGRDELH